MRSWFWVHSILLKLCLVIWNNHVAKSTSNDSVTILPITRRGRQRGCSPVSRRSQVRPRNTAADGPSLATSAWACEVQAVRSHAPLPYWSGAAIFDRAGSACRQYCSSSPALGVICWSCRAFNSPFNHRWPRVRCCRSTSVEQPTIWHSNVYIIKNQHV